MKKIFLPLIVFAGLVSLAQAEPPKQTQPDIGQFVSMANMTSTNTAVVTSTDSVVISNYPLVLQSVFVNNAGSADAHLEIYNSRVSTSVFERKICNLSTNSANHDKAYNIYLSSGMAIFNQGTTPADITISYLER